MRTIVLFALMMCGTMLMAQTLPGTYTTSWVGNSYGLGLTADRQNGKWVQDAIFGACVGPNGWIYTTSGWDEGGRNSGIYGGKLVDGVEIGNVYGTMATGSCVNETGHVGKEYCANGVAVAANSNNSFAVFNGKIYRYSVQGCNGVKYKDHNAQSMYATNNQLLTVDGTTVRLYDLANGNQLSSFTVPDAGPCAIAPNGELWVVSGVVLGSQHDRGGSFWLKKTGVEPVINHYSAAGSFINQIANPVGQSTWWPTYISFDNNGKLLVSDAGYRRQILFFNPSTLGLEDSFGQLGGISAGIAGVNAPDKFYGQMQAGTDSTGNLYVICEGMGSIIRKFDTNRNMKWQLNSVGFVESGDADPATDGVDVYTPNEHYKIDYSKTAAGTEWSPYAYTMDRIAFPNDPRVTSWRNSSVVRTINGNRIMFVYTMASGAAMDFYKFDNEIAVHTGSFDPGSWAACPDKNANIWYVNNNKIYRKSFSGFDGSGNPDWGVAEFISNNPGNIGHIERIEYFPDDDVLYLTGDIPSGDWGTIGFKMEKWTNWMNGTRTKAWTVNLPYFAGSEVPGKNRQKAICFAGDFIFSVGVETRCKVWVYNASNGSVVGHLEPGPEVNGTESTGWVDIPMGIRAIKRSNGEYVVFVEEDGFAKVLMFRWAPGKYSSVTGVNVSPDSTSIVPGGTIQLTATVSPSDATNKTVSWLSGNTSVATVNSSGLVTAVAAGSTTITVTTQDGNKTATCAIIVRDVKLTGIQFDNITPYDSNADGDKAFDGDTATFVDASTASGAYTGLDFGSSKTVSIIKFYPRENWAARMNEGKFQGSDDNANWTDIYTINTNPAYAWTEVPVNVNYRYVRYLSPANGYCNVAEIEFWGNPLRSVPVTGVSISLDSASIVEEDTQQLTATVSPSDATNKTVSWVSGDPSVATVNSGGLVTGVSPGSTTITVTTQDRNKTATCAITVRLLNTVKLTGTQFDNISPWGNNTDGDKAFDGNTATYVDANDASGAYTGLDFGSSKTVSIIKFYPRENWAARMNGGKFQGSDDNSNWTDIYTINTNPAYAWTEVPVNVKYRYVRYLSPANGHCNVAEIEFWNIRTVTSVKFGNATDSFSMFPNPVEPGETLKITGVENSMIRIIGLNGSVFLVAKCINNEIQIPASLKSGLYVLSLTSGGIIKNEKLIVR